MAGVKLYAPVTDPPEPPPELATPVILSATAGTAGVTLAWGLTDGTELRVVRTPLGSLESVQLAVLSPGPGSYQDTAGASGTPMVSGPLAGAP